MIKIVGRPRLVYGLSVVKGRRGKRGLPLYRGIDSCECPVSPRSDIQSGRIVAIDSDAGDVPAGQPDNLMAPRLPAVGRFGNSLGAAPVVVGMIGCAHVEGIALRGIYSHGTAEVEFVDPLPTYPAVAAFEESAGQEGRRPYRAVEVLTLANIEGFEVLRVGLKVLDIGEDSAAVSLSPGLAAIHGLVDAATPSYAVARQNAMISTVPSS